MSVAGTEFCLKKDPIGNTVDCLFIKSHLTDCSWAYNLESNNPSQVVEGIKKEMTNLIDKAADPNAPMAASGNQSDLQHRFDLVDGPAMYEMTNVLYKGALKYGENNWRNIPVEDHLNHLIAHVYAYLAGNRDDRHLANIMCRAMFAQGKALMDEAAEFNDNAYAFLR